jgi:hypothetical protein
LFLPAIAQAQSVRRPLYASEDSSITNTKHGFDTVYVHGTAKGNATVSIASSSGKVIKTYHIIVKKGSNHIPVDLRGFPYGTYFIDVSKNGKVIGKSIARCGR